MSDRSDPLDHSDCVRVIESRCPNCNAKHDHLTQPEDAAARPEPGSMTMCLICGFLEVFGPSMVKRPLTYDEMQGFDSEQRTEIAKMELARLMTLQEHGPTFARDPARFGPTRADLREAARIGFEYDASENPEGLAAMVERFIARVYGNVR